MKKSITPIVIAVLVIVVSSVTAAALDQKSVVVNATVAPYAVITVNGSIMAFGSFSGASVEVRGPRNNAAVSVETNTALDLRFSAGDLTLDTSFLETKYETFDNLSGNSLGYFNRDENYVSVGALEVVNAQAAKTTGSYSCMGWARTGPNITSQDPGEYSATITVTASVH